MFHEFGSADDPLVRELGRVRQAAYLRLYLADLGAKTVMEERAYFDRDYLSEFAAFYGVSSRGYSNRCGRLHFFKERVDRRVLHAAAKGGRRAIARLQEAYLGFVVLRPIPSARLGRTVVAWYPDDHPHTPRVIEPSRTYECHIAGVTLKIHGLAWQQQDTGVGACATVALWSMLHSSAFDDHHAIPTTADITRFAHRTASLGARVFPSSGLRIEQLCEAIKESGLAPLVLQGDKKRGNGRAAFSRARFAAACASLIRSSYPALIVGELEGQGSHAVCAVGFRECAPPAPAVSKIDLHDRGIEYLYVHDDNLGPSVRFRVEEDKEGVVRLVGAAPPSRRGASAPSDPIASYPALIPSQIVSAVHQDLRTSPDRLHDVGLRVAATLCDTYNDLVEAGKLSGPKLGLTISTRFMKFHRYLDGGLDRVLVGRPLARVRLALTEQVGPMSLHIGVVRIGWRDVPLLDVLYDTTDSDSNLTPFCNVQFDPLFGQIANALHGLGRVDLGESVRGT